LTPELRERIALIRRALEAADPTIGFLAPPSLRKSLPEDVPLSYQEFLREVDGAACGVVMLYEADGLLQHQADAKSLPGGRQRWFCFGAVEDYPLVIDRESDAVHLVPVEGDFDEAESMGTLDHFLIASVLGPEYEEFIIYPEDDAWYQFVRQYIG
jgi:hypothetical protein